MGARGVWAMGDLNVVILVLEKIDVHDFLAV